MLDILFVTDFVCPFCIVEKENLKLVLKELGQEAKLQILPFELTEEPKERVDTCHDEKRKEHYKILEEPAKELGLDAKFPPNVCPRPYTRLAFEGLFYAEEKGLADEYADAMYHAYFVDEQDIGDMEVLCSLAEQVGLDKEEYREVLLQGKYTAKEKEANAHSKQTLGVTSVPTIYVNGEKLPVKEFTKAELKGILESVCGK